MFTGLDIDILRGLVLRQRYEHLYVGIIRNHKMGIHRCMPILCGLTLRRIYRDPNIGVHRGLSLFDPNVGIKSVFES